ncbi:MAG UNVERIFIED_CONTAM: DEAD/DEAH box helicase [Planctomycetaceae bacterium]
MTAEPIFHALEQDQLDVLLVSPERLGNPAFAARLPQLLSRTSLIVIDEAHCISDWGFDFRPDYQRLARSLLAAPNAAVLATTATANQRVTEDVRKQLGNNTAVFRRHTRTYIPPALRCARTLSRRTLCLDR